MTTAQNPPASPNGALVSPITQVGGSHLESFMQ
jgi:hypothetical protein